MARIINKDISSKAFTRTENLVHSVKGYLVRKIRGRGGVIVIDKDGNCCSGLTTKKMIHGWIEKGGKTSCRF